MCFPINSIIHVSSSFSSKKKKSEKSAFIETLADWVHVFILDSQLTRRNIIIFQQTLPRLLRNIYTVGQKLVPDSGFVFCFHPLNRTGIEYLKVSYNYLQMLNILCVLLLIPLRFLKLDVQFDFAAIAYMLICLRMLMIISITK